ncbi:MAG: spondin domain-containing protein [Patescibacteria group bacterium]
MKHFIVMLSMVLLAGAIITTGLWQREQERLALEFAREQAMQNRSTPPPNIDNTTSDTDPFGLFGPEETAYEVTLSTEWTPDNHGEYFLSTAHFSSPVVWVGKDNPVFSLQAPASPGIEEMAEEGRTRTLKKELEALLELGEIQSFNIYERVETPDTFSFEVKVDRDHSVISLVSMIAPSPDWFVALEGLDMLKEGSWRKQVEIPLLVLDAGTEDGSDFRLLNTDTNPRGVISTLVDIPAQELPPFATLRFREIGYSEVNQQK